MLEQRCRNTVMKHSARTVAGTQNAEIQMLEHKCWNTDAETQMLEHRCWNTNAGTQMLKHSDETELEHRSWNTDAGTQMLEHRCKNTVLKQRWNLC